VTALVAVLLAVIQQTFASDDSDIPVNASSISKTTMPSPAEVDEMWRKFKITFRRKYQGVQEAYRLLHHCHV